MTASFTAVVLSSGQNSVHKRTDGRINSQNHLRVSSHHEKPSHFRSYDAHSRTHTAKNIISRDRSTSGFPEDTNASSVPVLRSSSAASSLRGLQTRTSSGRTMSTARLQRSTAGPSWGLTAGPPRCQCDPEANCSKNIFLAQRSIFSTDLQYEGKLLIHFISVKFQKPVKGDF